MPGVLVRRCSGRRISLILAALILSPLVAPRVAAAASSPPVAQFFVGPSNSSSIDGRSYFNVVASPGATISDHFALVNLSTHSLTLQVHGVDATSNSNGAIVYQSAKAAPTDGGTWLAPLPGSHGNVFTVPARTTRVVAFQLHIPKTAHAGDHIAGIAVTAANSTQRVITELYIHLRGTALATLEVHDVHASFSGGVSPLGGSAIVRYTVRNAGNVDLSAKQQVNLSGMFGDTGMISSVAVGTRTVATEATGSVVVADLAPGGSVQVTVHFTGVVAAVRLNARVRVTPEAPIGTALPGLNSVSSSTSLWAIPWSSLVLLLIVVAAGFAYHRNVRQFHAKRPLPSHRLARGTTKVTVSSLADRTFADRSFSERDA